jgi:hypothetical protein
MLNKLVIAPADTTVQQQKNEHEEICQSTHASTLTITFTSEASTRKLSTHETL